MSSYFSTPPTSSVNTYIGGIPSSIVAADRGREVLQSYDNIYDTNTTTQQQLTTLQNQMIDLRNHILSLQYAKSSQVITDAVNWIANGDCSQFTLPQPVLGTSNAASNNQGFILNGRAVPIMDRWYHVFEGSGFNVSNFKMEAKQVKLTNYITGTPAYGTVPSSTTYGMSVMWFNHVNTNACFTLENSTTAKYGGMIAVQHVVPNIRAFRNTSYVLGFWIYSSTTTSAYVRILRQYNITQKGGISLDSVAIQTFTVVGGGWKYVTMSIKFPELDFGKTLNDDESGCVIQIGPCYYNWKLVGGVYTPTTYGSTDPFTRTTPGVEFVIAEVQMRSDVSSLDGLAFPNNLREDERTLKYITYVAPSNPTNKRSVTSGQTTTLGLGNARIKPGADYDFYALFHLPYASRLIRRPTVIYWCAKAGTTATATGILPFPNTTTVYNSDNGQKDRWGPATWPSLDIEVYPIVLRYEGTPIVTHIGGMTSTNHAFVGQVSGEVQVVSFSENSLHFKGRGNYSDLKLPSTFNYADCSRSSVPTDVALYSNRSADWGYFTVVVGECDMGLNGTQVELLSYVDFTITAPTSLPL